MTVISALWEPEAGDSQIGAQSRLQSDLLRPYVTFKRIIKRDWKKAENAAQWKAFDKVNYKTKLKR